MTVIRYEIEVDAPHNRVWELMADLGGIHKFHPFVPTSYYVTDQLTGVGASRVCEFDANMAVEETVTHWQEGQTMTLQIDFIKGMKPPINNLRGIVSVKPSGTNQSLAALEMRYDPKFGPIGSLMDKMMIRRQYAKMIPGILKGLKHHAETGEDVDLRVLTKLSNIKVSAA